MTRILYVDDDETWLSEVERMLGREFTVDSATTVQEAERQLRLRSYDLALIDLWLDAGQTGDELLDTIIEEYPGTRRIVITGQSMNESTKAYVERYRLDDFVFKGDHLPEDFLAAVRGALSRPAGGLASDIVARKTELSFQLRVEVRAIGSALRDELWRAREQLGRLADLHPDLILEAQQRAAATRERLERLHTTKLRLMAQIDGVRSAADADRVSDEIALSLGEFENDPSPNPIAGVILSVRGLEDQILRLPTIGHQQLVRADLETVIVAASSAWGPTAIPVWLTSPNMHLDTRTPVECVLDGQTPQVLDALGNEVAGVFS